jgi:hypothetical protein
MLSVSLKSEFLFSLVAGGLQVTHLLSWRSATDLFLGTAPDGDAQVQCVRLPYCFKPTARLVLACTMSTGEVQ